MISKIIASELTQKSTKKIIKTILHRDNFNVKLSDWIKNYIIKNKDRLKLKFLESSYPFFFNEEYHQNSETLKFKEKLLEMIIEKVKKSLYI